jgi:hypothetical protein
LVVSDFPLADILHNRDATGRISKWAVELGALTLDFKPRTAIKSQSLVDFMVEWRENQVEVPANQPEHWVMYFDGSLKLGGGGAGVLFTSHVIHHVKTYAPMHVSALCKPAPFFPSLTNQPWERALLFKLASTNSN